MVEGAALLHAAGEGNTRFAAADHQEDESMKRKAITQREARAMRKRVSELEGVLEGQRNAWVRDWFGGTHIASFETAQDDDRFAAIFTARRLGHAVVLVATSYKSFNAYAIQLQGKPE